MIVPKVFEKIQRINLMSDLPKMQHLISFKKAMSFNQINS